MKCLVTGGAGFIGSHLVDRLVNDGHEVVVIDNFSTGKEENLSSHLANNQITIYRQSICDNLDSVFTDAHFDAVFHLAALPRVQFSIQSPIETHESNVNGTLNLLDTCRRHGVKRFVFSSSSSVYGDQDKLPLIETMTPNPMSPYALHKLIGEYYCNMFFKLYNIETISLRYFNVYGSKRQSPEGDYACLIPKFIVYFNDGKTPTINGDGEQTRDATYVGDVVEANVLAATTIDARCFGEAFNIGAGVSLSVNEMTAAIKELTKSAIQPIHGPAVIEPRDTRADITKSASLLGWTPRMKFEDGLKKMVESINE